MEGDFEIAPACANHIMRHVKMNPNKIAKTVSVKRFYKIIQS